MGTWGITIFEDDLLQKAIDTVNKIKTDKHIHYTLLWVESRLL